MAPTLIRKVKLPVGSGVVAEWAAVEVAADEHGRWLFSPRGTRYVAQQGGVVVGTTEVGQGDRPSGVPVLHLVPTDGWWFAAFYVGHVRGLFPWSETVTVDLCRPPAFVDGAWTYVDLELDLAGDLGGSGEVVIVDEDELADAVANRWMTPEEDVAVRAVAADLSAGIAAGAEPFGTRWSDVWGMAAEGRTS